MSQILRVLAAIIILDDLYVGCAINAVTKYSFLQNINDIDQIITDISIDTSKDSDRGTLFVSTLQGLVHIYYPDSAGNYYKKQTLTRNQPSLIQVKTFQTQSQSIVTVACLEDKISIYRQKKTSTSKYSPTELISTGSYGIKTVHMYSDKNGEYLIVCKISQFVDIFYKSNQKKAKYQLIQKIPFQEKSELLGCTLLSNFPVFQSPFLFLVYKNEILFYQLQFKAFKQRQSQIILPDLEAETQTMSLMDKMMKIEVKSYEPSTISLFIAGNQGFAVVELEYKQNEFVHQIRQVLKKQNPKDTGTIRRIKMSDDGYLAVLLSNNIIELYHRNLDRQFQKFEEMKLNDNGYDISEIAFSDNHYQLIVTYSDHTFNVYFSKDSPKHKTFNFANILVLISPILGILIVTAMIILIFLRKYRKNSHQILHNDQKNSELRISQQDLFIHNKSYHNPGTAQQSKGRTIKKDDNSDESEEDQ